ncbi:MAG: pyridoxal-phosphate dependent enzyme, partial [Clostridia bacterium]|nr:pyridoxal-phosphate dependent enzyme [Clostridia bacterium]
TAREIWAQADGKIDIFAACVGTGGTLTGIGRYLTEQNPNIQIIAIEPSASPLLSEGKAGAHGIQGIGANFIPSVLDCSVYDRVITVSDEEAFFMARTLQKTDGLFVGISSGAAVAAAVKLAKEPENKGKRIWTVLPDEGGRYLSIL